MGIYIPPKLEEDTNHPVPTLSQRPGLPGHHWSVPLGGGCESNTPRRIVWRENLEDEGKVFDFLKNVFKNPRGRKATAEGTYQQDDYLVL